VLLNARLFQSRTYSSNKIMDLTANLQTLNLTEIGGLSTNTYNKIEKFITTLPIISIILTVFVGVPGNITSLFVLSRGLRHSKAYINQLLVVGNDLFNCCLSLLLVVLSSNLTFITDIFNITPWTYASNYYILFFTTHFCSTLISAVSVTAVYFMIFICYDRAQMVSNPQKYATVDKEARFIGIAITGLIVGYASTVHQAFRRYVEEVR
jgi:hypothetical protein